ncbi:hypothetical protein Tco_1561284 [Tanacetum coccineum]
MLMVDGNVGNQFRENALQNVGHLVRQNEVQNQGTQNVRNQNGLSVVSETAKQYGNGDVVTSPTKGNGNGINGAYDEIEKVTANYNLLDSLQQASTLGTQSDKAPVYDSDGSSEEDIPISSQAKVQRLMKSWFILRRVLDGAFGGVGDEEGCRRKVLLVISSSLEMLTNSCLGGIMVSLIFLEGFEEEAFVEFMIDFG